MSNNKARSKRVWLCSSRPWTRQSIPKRKNWNKLAVNAPEFLESTHIKQSWQSKSEREMCAEGFFIDTLLSEFILFCSGKALWLKAPETKKGLTTRTRQYSKAALPKTVLSANLIYSDLTGTTGAYSAACSDGKKAYAPLPGCGCSVFLSVGSSISKASFVTYWSTNTTVIEVWYYNFSDLWHDQWGYG